MSDPKPTRSQGDLAEMLELLLDKGVIVNADVAVTVGDTELLGVQVHAAVASFETAAEYGLAFPSGTDVERVAAAAGVDDGPATGPAPEADAIGPTSDAAVTKTDVEERTAIDGGRTADTDVRSAGEGDRLSDDVDVRASGGSGGGSGDATTDPLGDIDDATDRSARCTAPVSDEPDEESRTRPDDLEGERP